MSEYSWPNPATRPLLGKKISRVDGPVKVSGRAKYTFDYNPDGLLAGNAGLGAAIGAGAGLAGGYIYDQHKKAQQSSYDEGYAAGQRAGR